MVRSPSVDENGLVKGAWSEEEDNKLKAYVQRYGHWNWRQLPRFAGLARCGKSCRLRWMNYLKPGVRRGNYTPQEEDLILQLNKEFGNRWSFIASRLPGRTDNEIKNYWHTHLRRRAKQERKLRAAGEASVYHHHHNYQESSSLSTFDSTEEKNDGNSMNIINFATQVDDHHHVYSEVSSYYDPIPSTTPFQDIGTVFGCNSSANNLKPWGPLEQIMQPFGESSWDQSFSFNTDHTLLPRELPSLVEEEIICPFSPYFDENFITWLHDFLQQ